ncbi:MAG: hypothetical protein IPI53_16925 [Saprospiraceae bacterium]|nr:hypothetical protein [Saprospiraceae bacterium]
MTNPLQEKGWIQMKQILDKEMPQKNRNFVLPIWLIASLMLFCFMGGFFLHKYKTAKLNPKHNVSTIAHPTNSVKGNQYKKNTKSLHSDNELIGQRNKNNNLATSPTFQKSISDPNKMVYNNVQIFPAYTSVDNVLSETTSFNTQNQSIPKANEVNLHPDNLSPSITTLPLTLMSTDHPFSLTPLSRQKEKKTNNTYHNLFVTSGIQNFRSKNYVLGFGYMFEKRFKKLHPYVSVGYRLVSYNIAEYLDTLAMSALGEFGNQKNTEIKINNIHQLELALGAHYNFYKNYVISGGISFPYRYNKIQYSENLSEKYFEDTASNPNGNPESNELQIKNTYSNFPGTYQSIDMVPFIGFGANLSSKFMITAMYRHGLYPIIKIPVLSHTNHYENQLGIQIRYTLQ